MIITLRQGCDLLKSRHLRLEKKKVCLTVEYYSSFKKGGNRPFLAAVEVCLVGPPPPPPRRPNTLSLLPSEDVLLPAQPQPSQGASRLHQSPRVGECSLRRRGWESRCRARSGSCSPSGALCQETGSSGNWGAARPARAAKPPLPPGTGPDGTGRAGRGSEAKA